MPVLSYVLMTVLILILLAAVVAIYLVMPAKSREAKLSMIYAHRGYHDDEHPENSLSAFRRAAEHGLGVELDVQLTRDKKLVVFHDKNLSRVCGVDKDLCELDFAELRKCRLSGGDESIPLLSEVLEALDGAPIICEIKTYIGNSNCELCPELCRQIDAYSGHTVIESFSPFILKWFRQNRPDIIRGQLSANFGRSVDSLSALESFALSNLLTNFMARPDFIAYHFEASCPGLALCKIFGPTLVAWTVRSREDIEKAAQAGYEAFICENFELEDVD